jgi:type I site-specific restriction endonuclease
MPTPEEQSLEAAGWRAQDRNELNLAAGLPGSLSPWHRPLPFLYESMGVETFFTHTRDPEPRSRRVFAFRKPRTLAEWAKESDTLRARLRQMPPVGARLPRPLRLPHPG